MIELLCNITTNDMLCASVWRLRKVKDISTFVPPSTNETRSNFVLSFHRRLRETRFVSISMLTDLLLWFLWCFPYRFIIRKHCIFYPVTQSPTGTLLGNGKHTAKFQITQK